MVKSDVCCHKSGCYRTMGLPQVCLCPPQNFLRKQSRAPITVRVAASKSTRIGNLKYLDSHCLTFILLVPKVQFGSAGGTGKIICESGPSQFDGAGDSTACGGGGDADAACGNLSETAAEGSMVANQGDYVPAKARVPRLCCNRQKPAIPSACNGYAIIERGKKDFVMDNALKVIRQPAKVPQSIYVDQAKGTRLEWRNSGYARKYVTRGDYGMIPGYMVNRKKELYEAEQMAKGEAEAAECVAKSKCRHLDEIERQSMLNGLKENWAETFREFQSLPLLIDTEALTKKKYKLEEALKDLEKDIQLMERHNHIFVADTDKSFYL